MLKTRQLHIVKESFGGSKDEPWGYYFWEDNEKPRHVYTAFCYKRGHATTVCAKDLDVVVKCEACATLDFDDGVIMTGLSGMVKDVQFDDDEATQFVLNFKNKHKFMPFKDEEFLKVLDNLIAKRDNKMIIEQDKKEPKTCEETYAESWDEAFKFNETIVIEENDDDLMVLKEVNNMLTTDDNETKTDWVEQAMKNVHGCLRISPLPSDVNHALLVKVGNTLADYYLQSNPESVKRGNPVRNDWKRKCLENLQAALENTPLPDHPMFDKLTNLVHLFEMAAKNEVNNDK